MSRGPGRVERALVDVLTDDWVTVANLAARITGSSPTRSQLESVRRAVRHLAATGYAELDYLYDIGRHDWDDPNSQGELWSALGDGRSADPGHRPRHPGWQLAARFRP